MDTAVTEHVEAHGHNFDCEPYILPADDGEALHDISGRLILAQSPEVRGFRSPGSWLAEYATGQLSADQVVELAKKVDFCCCMDERCQLDGVKGFITSHAGCGAAGLIAKEAAKPENDAIRRLLAQFVGDEELNDTEYFQTLVDRGATDKLGILWARVLAEKANKPYQHIEVDADLHHTMVDVIDFTGLVQGMQPEVGKRAFVNTSPSAFPEVAVEKQIAYQQVLRSAVLSTAIAAHGGHSTVKNASHPERAEEQYSFVVIQDAGFDQALFDAAYQEAIIWVSNLMKMDITGLNRRVIQSKFSGSQLVPAVGR